MRRRIGGLLLEMAPMLTMMVLGVAWAVAFVWVIVVAVDSAEGKRILGEGQAAPPPVELHCQVDESLGLICCGWSQAGEMLPGITCVLIADSRAEQAGAGDGTG